MSQDPSSEILEKEILNRNIPEAWKRICDNISGEGKDFRNLSKNPKKGVGERWFHASSIGNVVFIEKAWEHPEKSKIKDNKKYHIYYSNFEIAARLYNEYASGESYAIRHTDDHMTTYEITLIAELL
jgi:predicted DNA-binding ArsR family transcriptional regulator